MNRRRCNCWWRVPPSPSMFAAAVARARARRRRRRRTAPAGDDDDAGVRRCRPGTSTSSTTPTGSPWPFRRRGRTSRRRRPPSTGALVPTINVATDLASWSDTLRRARRAYAAFPFTADPQTLLDRFGLPSGCGADTVVPYADGVFTGSWAQWTRVRATAAAWHLIVASPADHAFTAVGHRAAHRSAGPAGASTSCCRRST